MFESICAGLDMPELTDLGRLLISCGFQSFDLKEFSKCLSHSGLTSVDQFLEDQGEGWIKLGKHAIAASLLPREKLDLLFRDPRNDSNWLKILFRGMKGTIESFPQNKLTVITYNYDRSIEQFLFTSLKSIYDLKDDACASVLDKFPIIHLHGQLSPITGKPGTIVGYGEELTSPRVMLCAKNIRIIHEPIEGVAEFDQAHKAIQNAEKIAFLGFGYNKKNLDRLLPTGLRPGRRPAVYASVLGLGVADIHAIRNYLKTYFSTGEVFVGSASQDINGMLHDFPILPFF